MKKIMLMLVFLCYTSIILNSETDSFELDSNWTDAYILQQLADPNSKLSQYLNKDNGREGFLADLNKLRSQPRNQTREPKNANRVDNSGKRLKQD